MSWESGQVRNQIFYYYRDYIDAQQECDPDSRPPEKSE